MTYAITKEIEYILEQAINQQDKYLLMKYYRLDNIQDYIAQKLYEQKIIHNENTPIYQFLFSCQIELAFNKKNFSLLGNIFEDISDAIIEYQFVEAIRREDIPLLEFLISKNVNIHQKVAGKNYLERAIDNNNIKSVKTLIQASFDIHINNDSAIRYAAQSGLFEICQYLIENNADIHALNNYALRYSMQNNYNEIVKLLLNHGADITANNGQTFLLAALNSNKEMIQYFIDHNFTIQENSIYQNTNVKDDIKLFIKDYILYHKANQHKNYLDSILVTNDNDNKKLKL